VQAKLQAADAFTAAIDTGSKLAAYAGNLAWASGAKYLAWVHDAASLASVTTPFALNNFTEGLTFNQPWQHPALAGAQVEKLYLAYFGRAADPAGLAFWSDRLDGDAHNATLPAIEQAFGSSAEYDADYGKLGNLEKVISAYEHLFGRDPDFDGLNYWNTKLVHGELRVDQVVMEIANGARGDDLLVLNGKASVASAITAAIDQPAEWAAYTNHYAQMMVQSYLANVVDVPSIAASLDPAAIDSLIFEFTVGTPVVMNDHASLVGVPPVML
jgi:hypothetical protein